MKKNIVYILLVFIIFILLIVFVNNNDFLYKDKIIKINNIEIENEDYDYNDLGVKETIYKENITGVVTNGKDKGNIISIKYDRYKSLVVSEKYRVGDKVFIKDNEIDGLKRDKYFVYVLFIFFVSILVIGKKRGLLTIVSVIFNSLIFYLSIILYNNGKNIIVISIIISIIYTILSLIAASGFNKKSFSAILSVLLSEVILFLLIGILAVITNFDGINFNVLSYLTVPPEEVFISGLLIGGLGAIMDVSITISSSISEMIEVNKDISVKEIIKSSKHIGSDIMPTMINVLFFTYFCSALPTFVLAIRNGFTVHNFLSTFYTLEITRFLCGSIGICLSIIISIFISIRIFKRGDVYE